MKSRGMRIEFDLPEFEKEIKVEIIIRKDGEVVYSSSSSTSNKETDTTVNSVVKENSIHKEIAKKSTGESKFGGNFMNMDF